MFFKIGSLVKTYAIWNELDLHFCNNYSFCLPAGYGGERRSRECAGNLHPLLLTITPPHLHPTVYPFSTVEKVSNPTSVAGIITNGLHQTLIGNVSFNDKNFLMKNHSVKHTMRNLYVYACNCCLELLVSPFIWSIKKNPTVPCCTKVTYVLHAENLRI